MLTYDTHGAEVVHAELLPELANIQPFPGEQPKPAMDWHNWHEAFQGVSGELRNMGLTYQGCRLAVSYIRYANRGDHADPRYSRSQAVVSEWSIGDQGAVNLGYPDADCGRLTAFFPVYDGIGFWIGKRRRETGVNHYTQQQEVAMAQASAIGAMGVGQEFAAPSEPHHMVYRCVWAPGRAFAADGSLIANSTNTAFAQLGFRATEVERASEAHGTLPFRLFGDCRVYSCDGDTTELPFVAAPAELLHGAWKAVNLIPGVPDAPSPDSY
ncbi:MAG TPA: hypothetical protein VLH84_05380 [Patescibacteria group bacterium]|nr:hypothetical protein [Patescibacteria group bacterium]